MVQVGSRRKSEVRKKFLKTNFNNLAWNAKGTPLRSGRVTHLKRFFSKTCIFL